MIKYHSFLASNLSVGSHNSDAGDRDVLIDEARLLFGEDAVIPVSNFNTLKLKSLLLDIGKFHGVPAQEIFELTRDLQEEVMVYAKDESTEKSVFVLKHNDCMEYSQKYQEFMTKYPAVKHHIEMLFMQNRSLGRHAGGVIIADGADLSASMPIIQVKGELQTPWTEGMNFRNLEDNGFIKYDFLGLTLMEDIKNCIVRILINAGNTQPSFQDVKAFFDKHLNCRFNKLDDENVFKTIYCSGKWFPGIFQFTACLASNASVELADGGIMPIIALKPGMMVSSYNETTSQFEPRAVKELIDSGIRECVELKFDNGKTLVCTPDHLLLTRNRGWVTALDLCDEDDIVDNG